MPNQDYTTDQLIDIGKDLAADVQRMWEDAKKDDPRVRDVLEDPRTARMTTEQLAGMFFGLGAFAALRIAVTVTGSKDGPKRAGLVRGDGGVVGTVQS